MKVKTPARFEVRPIIGQRLPGMRGRHQAMVPRNTVKVLDLQTRRALAYGSPEAMAEVASDLNAAGL